MRKYTKHVIIMGILQILMFIVYLIIANDLTELIALFIVFFTQLINYDYLVKSAKNK